MNANEIYLTSRNKIIFNRPTEYNQNIYAAAAFAKNLEGLGFGLSKNLFEKLSRTNISHLEVLYNEIVPVLKKMTGAHVKFAPMYPNFPAQVMNATDLELFLNSMIHYWGDLIDERILPSYEVTDRAPLLETTRLRLIDLGDQDDFNLIFTSLVGSNSSISESDKEIISWFVRTYIDIIHTLFPANIPFKEQVGFLASELIKYTTIVDKLQPYIKTATDVLRISVALSNGDVSLASPMKFIKFNRKTRRFLLNMIERSGDYDNITEDMLKWKDRWIRLGEVLHPGEYQSRYPKTYKAFDVIRNDKPFSTFNSQIESSLDQLHILDTIDLLKDRPGEFARRLDHIHRICNIYSNKANASVINRFLDVSDKVSTPVLMQVYSHFKNRGNSNLRMFFPKGNIGKAQVVKNNLSNINPDTIQLIVDGIRNKLVNRFSKLSSLGKVYLDENLKNYIIPFSQRSASKSLRTLSRGSKVNIPDGNTLRFFLWWKNGVDRTDIDLSVVVYDENWTENTRQELAYYALRNNKLGLYHSGDITSAPNGACEFIDVDTEALQKSGYRHVVPVVNSYTQQSFINLPECFAGWMIRQRPQSGEIFEPKTVVDKVDLTADTKICIPVIIDVVNRKVTWTDLALKNRSIFNNVRNNNRSISLIAQGMNQLDKPNLYDLFSIHAEARGTEILDNLVEADSIFSEYHGITPYDQDTILSEFFV